jgi:CRP/FNR family cyclic AMP-dependent transcriptional regulator
MSKVDTSSAAKKALTAIPYFAELDAKLLQMLAQAAVCRAYDPSEVVFLEGEPCAGLFVVESGWLKSVKMSPKGREQILRLVGAGEVFNEVGVLLGSTNMVSVVALERSIVWVIRLETFLQLLDQYPPLARIITQNLAQRVLNLLSLVEDLSLRPVEARLARLLLGQSTDGRARRHRWATQAEMASRLGTVPDVLNRALRSLVEQGLIAVERHQIKILDRKGLEAKSAAGG